MVWNAHGYRATLSSNTKTALGKDVSPMADARGLGNRAESIVIHQSVATRDTFYGPVLIY